MPKSTDIKRIVVGGRDVSVVKRNGVTLWTPTYGYVYTIENPQIEYSGSTNYLSARGYAGADDYVSVRVDVRQTLGSHSAVIFTNRKADVVATSQSWLTTETVHNQVVAIAASRGSVSGAARSANITSVSLDITIDGTPTTLTLSNLSLSVTQEANSSTADGNPVDLSEVVSFYNTSNPPQYKITTNNYTSSSKCPACGSIDDDSYAVITAQAWRIKGTRQYYNWTSGERTYVDNTTRYNVSPKALRFTLVDWEGSNPYRYVDLQPGSRTNPEEDGWQDEEGNVFTDNQRKVLFDSEGTEALPNGRNVKIIVEVLKSDGTAYPIASGESNDITLYQSANTAGSPTYSNATGTLTLSNWSESGTDTAVAEGEDNPVDTAVLTANVTVTKTTPYTSGESEVEIETPKFSNNTMQVIIPYNSTWVTQSANSDYTRNIHVANNPNTSPRTAYPSVFTHGQIVSTFAVKQAAFDEGGGDEPEPED